MFLANILVDEKKINWAPNFESFYDYLIKLLA